MFILSLDGGGVRSVFEAYILQNLLRTLNKPAHELFDAIIGVSAGAIVGGILAMGLNLDVETAKKQAKMVFERSTHVSNALTGVKYSGTMKQRLLKQTFGNATLGDVKTKLMVLVSTMSGNPVVYSSTNPEHAELPLWQVIDASTSAPIYFPPVHINGDFYMDGGVISNNPALLAIEQEYTRHRNNIAVLSIGTSMNSDVYIADVRDAQDFGLIRWLSEGLISVMTKANHSLYENIIPLLIGPGRYMRLTSRVVGDLDDTSDQMLRLLEKDGAVQWEMYGKDIVRWVQEVTM